MLVDSPFVLKGTPPAITTLSPFLASFSFIQNSLTILRTSSIVLYVGTVTGRHPKERFNLFEVF